MTEWDASCLPRKKEPLLVEVEWTDAASDNTFACTFSEVGKRATLMHHRKSDGRLVYLNVAGLDARLVLANLFDAAATKDDESMVENFMVIPWGWVERIKTHRGRTIYTRARD